MTKRALVSSKVRVSSLGLAVEQAPIRSLPFELWAPEHKVLKSLRSLSPSDIPPALIYSLKQGDHGYGVVGVQRGLADCGIASLVEDGDYGRKTKAAVKEFQRAEGIGDDGEFGPQSSAHMAETVETIVESGVSTPHGLTQGVVTGESGNLIAAVNWSVPGGVDCGYTQRRVLDSSFTDDAAVRRAFYPKYQINLLARSVRDRYAAFITRAAVSGDQEFCWRLAVLNHNYPSAADKISQVGISGLSDYWTTDQSWVVNIGAKFPSDGEAITTPLEWCRFYALGSAQHTWPGLTTRFVTIWKA